MSKDPVPEWFGKGEAEPARHRGTAEARSSVGCGIPVALALLIGSAGAGYFFLTKRPDPKLTSRPVSTVVTVATPTPELPEPPTPVPDPPPPAEEPLPTPPTESTEVVPEPSAPVVDGTERLSAAKIRLVMNNAKKRYRTCYENALNYAPDAQGGVRLSLTIGPTGRVQVASATQTGNLPPQVATCMTAISRTLKFPESPEPTTVTYPFVFNPG